MAFEWSNDLRSKREFPGIIEISQKTPMHGAMFLGGGRWRHSLLSFLYVDVAIPVCAATATYDSRGRQIQRSPAALYMRATKIPHILYLAVSWITLEATNL